MRGLYEFLNSLSVEQDGRVFIGGGGNDFIAPGYWAALAAHCRFNQIQFNQLIIWNKTKEYASAIALEHALSGTDGYAYQRKNSGVNYSPLVLLADVDDTDKATHAINGCIRRVFDTKELLGFASDLCDVAGDLHDNVWSHGKSTGFSMAQKWKKRYSNTESLFEFALADCGLGFLRELHRVNLPIQNDQEAIEWCIQEGNSSKKLKTSDDWSQRLPADMAGNPIPGIGKVVEKENHHMGLGLAKLIRLVNNYQGQLWLASGTKTLYINENGSRSFENNEQPWQGVALACRFDTEKAKNYKNNNNDEATASINELLRMQL